MWTPIVDDEDYIVDLYGMSMNDHFMQGSEAFTKGFFDSGTTYTYFP
jgi:hypothetical protein